MNCSVPFKDYCAAGASLNSNILTSNFKYLNKIVIIAGKRDVQCELFWAELQLQGWGKVPNLHPAGDQHHQGQLGFDKSTFELMPILILPSQLENITHALMLNPFLELVVWQECDTAHCDEVWSQCAECFPMCGETSQDQFSMPAARLNQQKICDWIHLGFTANVLQLFCGQSTIERGKRNMIIPNN